MTKAARLTSAFLFGFLLVACASCARKQATVVTPLPEGFGKKDEICRIIYLKFYQKPQLDFRVIFGYKDARPARFVGDRYEEAYFVQKLIQYGFERSGPDGDLFLKTLRGPDGAQHTIRLLVMSSSVGPDDDENRRDPFQAWKSARAEMAFLGGVESADLVFYYGHSRDGGGPSFSPPRLNSAQHVDYGWYLKNRQGLNAMVGAMQNRRRRDLKMGKCMIGLYSCVSDRLFSKLIHSHDPEAGTITSEQLLYFNDALNAMMQSLEGVIEMKCQSDFHPTGAQVRYWFEPG